MSGLSDKTRKKLTHVSAATISTVLFKRGLRNCFMQGPQRINPGANMVGEAYTLRYIPSREDVDTLEVFLDRSHPQRMGVEECPPGCVFVCDSRGDPSAASAGGILVSRLEQRGVAGIVTDGGFRDTPGIAPVRADQPDQASCRRRERTGRMRRGRRLSRRRDRRRWRRGHRHTRGTRR
jgi:regulator of RNase E activity RraA